MRASISTAISLLAATIVGALLLMPFVTRADDDEHSHRNRRADRAPASAPLAVQRATYPAVGVEATYREECGSCHLAYPPGLLPSTSWGALLQGLDAHFGQNAELDPATRTELGQWLAANAAERGSHRKSAKVLRSLGGAAPLRLTDVPYLRRKHHEVRAAVFARPSIGSRANCSACHPGAERWDFDEDTVSIPKT